MKPEDITPEERAKAYLAWTEGKEVEFYHSDREKWVPLMHSSLARLTTLRLKPKPPEPKWRPWKPEEVPMGAVLRHGGIAGMEFLIVGRKGQYEDSVFISEHNKVTGGWQSFTATKYSEYSLDHGKTWQKCGVVE